jgi:hypothetical protein
LFLKWLIPVNGSQGNHPLRRVECRHLVNGVQRIDLTLSCELSSSISIDVLYVKSKVWLVERSHVLLKHSRSCSLDIISVHVVIVALKVSDILVDVRLSANDVVDSKLVVLPRHCICLIVSSVSLAWLGVRGWGK